jgi:hypothetical protein
MEAIAAELVAGNGKRDHRGRAILSEERWAEAIAEYEKSEMTQKEFCRREGINIHTFVAHLGRSRQNRSTGATPRAFIEANLGELGGRSRMPLEIVLPCGTVLRGHDAASLAALVATLRKRT